MEAAKLLGVWWTPDRPDTRVAGTLSVEEDGRLELDLLGALVGRSDFHFDSPPIPVIHGDVDADVFGEIGSHSRAVTLSESRLSGLRSGSAANERAERFRPAQAYFGNSHLLQTGTLRFGSVALRFSGLNAWADTVTGFRTEAAFDVVWRHPGVIQGQVGGAGFVLGAGISRTGGKREPRLSEHVELRLNLDEPVGIEEIDRKYVYPLQNLFTLLTDAPNALTLLQVGAGSPIWSDTVRVVAPRTFTDETATDDLFPQQMLFPYSALADRFSAVLSAWLGLSGAHLTSLAMYFAWRYDAPRYVDLRLQLLLQAVALFVNRHSPHPWPVSEARAGSVPVFPPGYAGPSGTDDLLQSHPLVQAALALNWLERAYRIATGAADEAWNRFRVSVMNTLTYALTRRTTSGDVPLGEEYYWFAEGVHLLFKIALLVEVGVDEVLVAKRLAENPRNRPVIDYMSARP